MSTNAKARRAALLFLFLTLSLAATVAPASAVRIGPDGHYAPPGAPPPAPGVHHTDVVAGSGPGLAYWLLIGILAVAAVAGVALALSRRHRRTHRAALSS